MPIVLSPISNSFNPLPSARTSRARVLASFKLPQVPYPLQRLAFPTTYRPRSGANRLESSIHSFCHIPPTRWPPRRYPKCAILYNGLTICRPVYSIGVPIVLTSISSKFNARPVRAPLARPCPGLLQATPSAVSSTTTCLPDLLSTPLVCQSFAVYRPLILTPPARALASLKLPKVPHPLQRHGLSASYKLRWGADRYVYSDNFVPVSFARRVPAFLPILAHDDLILI